MSNFRIDFRGPLGKAKLLSDGSLKVPAYLARTGVQDYTYSDGRKVREHRPAEHVFSKESLDSFKGLALTVQHPGAKVDPSNWKAVAIGHVGEDVRQEGNLVAASLYIKDADTISRIQSGELVEISNGYECQMIAQPGRNDNGEEYDAIQSNIVGNHVAIGPANWGRAGSNVRLYLDSKASQVPSDKSASIAFSDSPLEAPMTDEEKKAKAEADKKAAEADKTKAPTPEPAPAPEPKPADPAPEAPVVQAPALKQPGNLDSNDAVKFDSAVDERLEVVAQAQKLVPSISYKGKTNAQIRREVVEAKGLKVDSKDDSYVAARFDSLLEDAAKQDSADGALGTIRVNALTAPSTKADAAEDARARMQARNAALAAVK